MEQRQQDIVHKGLGRELNTLLDGESVQSIPPHE